MTTPRNCVVAIVTGLVLAGIAPTRSLAQPGQIESKTSEWYAASDGTVTIDFDARALASLGLRFVASSGIDAAPSEHRFILGINKTSTLKMEARGGVLTGISGGSLQTRGALLLDRPGDRVVIGNLTIKPTQAGALNIVSLMENQDTGDAVLEMSSVMIDFHESGGELLLIGELAITNAWAEILDLEDSAGTVVGTVVVEAVLDAITDGAVSARACQQDSATNKADLRLAGIAGSDVLVAELQTVRTYGEIGGITAYAIGTTACNIGDARAKWISHTNQHPVIAQNLYRFMDNRFEQIGLSLVKHGFYAVSQSLCTLCKDPVEGGQELGVGCSDPYSATLNGIQINMSPRTPINPHTGYFEYLGNSPAAETLIERRLQVHNEDLDTALNPRARYFIQGHYVHPDDCTAGTQNNNASYREVAVERNVTTEFWSLITSVSWQTQRGQAAVRAWKDIDDSVVETDVQIPDEGLFILAAKATDFGTGIWRYEYALQNLNSDRAGESFSVPLPANAIVTNIGFHDVDYHSGEGIDPTDWPEVVAADAITWSTDSFAINENANALRWGTVYNFRFDVNAPPVTAEATIGLFKPGSPESVAAETVVPSVALIDCNDNGVADPCDVSCAAPGCSTPCGISLDCDQNSVPDECETDCNGNGTPDVCEVRERAIDDCNENGVPDECEPNEDCNANATQDICDIAAELSQDCNENLVPDECEPNEDCNINGVQDICDIYLGASEDCNTDDVPDECDAYLDCNRNGTRDICDIASGESLDCNGNEIPDECEPDDDCNTNGTQDICDIASGTSTDCNDDGTPDDCEVYQDCNINSVQDICDIDVGISSDCNTNSIPDECEPFDDCNDNGLQDFCELASGAGADCNLNGTLDACDINSQSSPDCNTDNIPDECEIDENSPASGGPWFCTQNCDPDCNRNGIPDECEVLGDTDGDGLLDCEDLCPMTNPQVDCVCPALQDCCFPDFCYSDLGLPPISYQDCLSAGGVPECIPSTLCRAGCLLGDYNDNGTIDLGDVAGLQECFDTPPPQPGSNECLRIFDFDDNGTLNLNDFAAFQDLYYNGP